MKLNFEDFRYLCMWRHSNPDPTQKLFFLIQLLLIKCGLLVLKSCLEVVRKYFFSLWTPEFFFEKNWPTVPAVQAPRTNFDLFIYLFFGGGVSFLVIWSTVQWNVANNPAGWKFLLLTINGHSGNLPNYQVHESENAPSESIHTA